MLDMCMIAVLFVGCIVSEVLILNTIPAANLSQLDKLRLECNRVSEAVYYRNDPHPSHALHPETPFESFVLPQ